MSATDKFTCEVKLGRLIEARVVQLKTPGEAREYSDALAAAVRSCSGGSRSPDPILCADHRPVAIYSQEVADELARLFGQMNSRLARVAILAAKSNATLVLQLGRIIREANNPRRRLFYDAAQAVEFLREDLSIDESQRAAAFLAEVAQSPSTRPP